MFERIVATAPGNTTDPRVRERMLTEGMMDYVVHIHSQPDKDPSKPSSKKDNASPPWVITLDNFLSDEECDRMIQLGYDAGYNRSEDVGEAKLDGTFGGKKSGGRTSENAWCSARNGCRLDPTAAGLHGRIAKLLDIPAENSEDFQILRYEKGQFYSTQ